MIDLSPFFQKVYDESTSHCSNVTLLSQEAEGSEERPRGGCEGSVVEGTKYAICVYISLLIIKTGETADGVTSDQEIQNHVTAICFV